MFKTVVFTSILALSFTSCSSKDALSYFSKGEKENRAVLNTKKADIFVDKKIKMMMWATYLNDTNRQEEFKTESFIVSTYFIEAQNHDFLNKNYQITLNKKSPKNIKKINIKNSKYESYINHNPWAEYYLIEFEKNENIYDFDLQLKKQKEMTSIKFVK